MHCTVAARQQCVSPFNCLCVQGTVDSCVGLGSNPGWNLISIHFVRATLFPWDLYSANPKLLFLYTLETDSHPQYSTWKDVGVLTVRTPSYYLCTHLKQSPTPSIALGRRSDGVESWNVTISLCSSPGIEPKPCSREWCVLATLTLFLE